MRTLLLQFRLDLTACRSLLLSWIVLLILYATGAAWFLHASAHTPTVRFPIGDWIAMGDSLYLLGGVLALWVVLRDPPADPNAFWQARPLQWSHLLVAKALVIGLLLFLPLLAVCAVLLVSAGDFGVLPAAAADLVRTRLPLILLFAAAAAVSRSLEQSLLVLATIAGTAFAVAIAWFSFGDGPRTVGVLTDLQGAWSRLFERGTVLATLTAVLWAQYAKRRIRFTIGIGVTVLILTLALDAGSWATRTRMKTAATLPHSEQPDFTIGISDNEPLWKKDGETGVMVGIVATLAIDDPPPPFVAIPQFFGHSEVRFPDGTIRNPHPSVDAWNPEHPVYRATFGAAVPTCTILNLNPWRVPTTPYVTLADFNSMRTRMITRDWPSGRETVLPSYGPEKDQGRVGTFHGRLHVEIQRMDPITRLPLKPGRHGSGPGERLMILGAAGYTSQGTVVNLRIRYLRLADVEARLHNASFLLVHNDRKEAYVSTFVGRMRGVDIHPYRQVDMQVFYRTGRDGDDQSIDQQWLEGAEVLAVHRKRLGTVVKDLQVENIRLWPDETDEAN